jgi:hypothetical protein
MVKYLVYTEPERYSQITVKEQWLSKENTNDYLILPGNRCSNLKSEVFAMKL